MQRSALTYLYLFLALAVLTLITVTYITSDNFQKLLMHTKKVEHTYAVLSQTQEVLGLLKDAESSQRGFLLTRDSIYLKPYRQAEQSVQARLDYLDNLVVDSKEQSSRVDTLQGLIQRRMVMLENVLKLSFPGKSALRDSLQTQQIVQGKAVMDNVVGVMTRMRIKEKELLTEREGEQAKTLDIMPFYLVLFSVLAILLFGITFFLVLRETVQRWEYEQQLEKSLAAQCLLNEEIDNFTFIANHQLQEPLRKTRIFADRLLHKHLDALDNDAKNTMQRMVAAAAQAQNLMEDLLTFSRFTAQNETYPFMPTPLEPVVRRVVEEQQANIQAVDAQVRVSGDWTTVFGNEVQLAALFGHLLENSLKFRREGVAPHIEISATCGLAVEGTREKVLKKETQREYCRIIFADNGIGIAPEYQNKIFRLFGRLHHQSEYPGTGLGLAICKKVVTNHGGSIEVNSEAGEGTTFTLYLPTTTVTDSTTR